MSGSVSQTTLNTPSYDRPPSWPKALVWSPDSSDKQWEYLNEIFDLIGLF